MSFLTQTLIRRGGGEDRYRMKNPRPRYTTRITAKKKAYCFFFPDDFGLIKEPRHSENISDETCLLPISYRASFAIGGLDRKGCVIQCLYGVPAIR